MQRDFVVRNPTRTLSRIEIVAAILCVPVAIYDYVIDPRDVANHYLVALYMLVAAAVIPAIFSLPHKWHRRYGAVAIAVLGIPMLGSLPPHDIFQSFVLGAVLGSRLTFAFGSRGALLGFAATYASLLTSVASQWHRAPLRLDQLAYGLFVYFVMLGLVFGVIGLLAAYAANAARAAAAAERARIALDLHDSFGHSLTTLNVHLQNAERLRTIDAVKADAYVERASALSAEVLNDVRETVSMLHDDLQTNEAPILPLLERLRSDFAAAYGIDLLWDSHFDNEPSGRSSIVLYRVLQEALTNIARHARAHSVHVAIRCDHREIVVSVKDDGCGFDENAAPGHGLLSMRLRVEAAHGTFDISSVLDAGTSLCARIPLESAL